MSGWIGVDLDRTLARYDGWRGINHIGEPIPAMVERIKGWLRNDIEVRIFTARWCEPEIREEFQKALHIWLGEAGLPPLKITNEKDFGCVEIWDDIAVQVIPNTGQRVGAV